MKETTLFLIVLLTGLFKPAFSQLSGTYTVGGSGSNFSNLTEVISALYSSGVSGPVTFNINPTTYTADLTFNGDIPGASEVNTVTLQSSTLNSASVIINGTVKFLNTGYLSIKAFTINNSNNAVESQYSFDIKLIDCIINVSQYNSDGAIYIRNDFSGSDWARILVKGCSITSQSPGIRIEGSKGRSTIEGCTFNTNGQNSVESWSATRINLNNCITGSLHLDMSTDCNLRNNNIYGMVYITHSDSILNNNFFPETAFFNRNLPPKDEETSPSLHTNSVNQHSRSVFNSRFVKSNNFYVPIQLKESASRVICSYFDNYFESSLSINGNGYIMKGNTFMDRLNLGCTSLLFEFNKVYGSMDFGDLSMQYNDYKVRNNVFFNEYVSSAGHYAEISYNNFLENAYLIVQFSDNEVHENNFCRKIESGFGGEGTNPATMSHNNYFPLPALLNDTSYLNIDPQYDPNNPGIATNPLLQGKSNRTPPATDFVGNMRKFPAAIGANEIFICSDSLNNVVSVPCGESFYPNLCGIPSEGDFWWTPDSLFTNPDTSYTEVHASENVTAYLHNSVHGIVDSLTINVQPFQVQVNPMPMFYCGWGMRLVTNYHSNASYHWLPETGLSDPYIPNPLLTVTDTSNTQWIVGCTVPGCGTSYDTLNIEFDPLPIPYIQYYEQVIDTIFFINESTCCDTYLWDFGDGSPTSTEENPYHVYTENGPYYITLTGTNSFGSRTTTVLLLYYFDEINSQEIAHPKVIPNPAQDYLTISGLSDQENEIRITDLSGRSVMNLTSYSTTQQIDLRSFKPGLYILHVVSGEKISSVKFVVN